MINEIIREISTKLNIKINNIKYFTEGSTESVVFSINNKYLIKTVDELTLKEQLEFLNTYKYDYFQKIIFYNEKLKYICFEFIEGNHLKEFNNLNIKDIINQLYKITNNYKEYDYDGYGYLFDDHKTWYKFLLDEVKYSKKEIENLNIDYEKVVNSLNIIKKYNVPKYLIHGDFGTHNFLIKNNNLKVIDPMGVVGDYLYDFYFSIFSNCNIFSKINIEYILDFYDRDLEYKKALMIVVFYIRMSRCFVYDRENFDVYLKMYNKL